MNWFKELYSKNRNPFYKKIEKLLRDQGLYNNMIESYRLGGSVYSEENHKKALVAIEKNTLKSFLNTIAYDTQKDNMEFFLINYKLEKPKLIIISDPFELYEKEKILNVFFADAIDMQGIPMKKIYP